MNFTRTGFLLFIAAGVLAIALLASLEPRRTRDAGVDRHTGKQVWLTPRTASQLLGAARRTGAAPAARDKILEFIDGVPDPYAARIKLAVFEAELQERTAPELHPFRDEIVADIVRAEAAERELDRTLTEMRDMHKLVHLLQELEADNAVGAATDAFFSGGKPPESFANKQLEQRVRTWAPADANAAYTLHGFRIGSLEPEVDVYRLVAHGYRAADRTRGRMRWLLRGLVKFPNDANLHRELKQAYLEHGRQREVFAVVGAELHRFRDEPETWMEREQLARWMGLHDQRIHAVGRLAELTGDPKWAAELVEIYSYRGRPEKALPYAVQLAENEQTAEAFERPVELALASMQVDEAFRLLERAAGLSDNPREWRERIVEYALQDLRYDRALHELENLHETYPDAGYEVQLEGLYRRRDMRAELADLLEERWRRESDDDELFMEIVGLHTSLGREDRVHDLMRQRLAEEEDLDGLLFKIPVYQAAGIDGAERLRELAAEQQLTPEQVQSVLDSLTALLDTSETLRAAALVLARRYREHPAARPMRLELIERMPTPEARAGGARQLAAEEPGDPDAVRVWVERSAWAGLLKDEIEARRAFVLLRPQDLENRRSLADLLEADGRSGEAGEHWAVLAEAEGPTSDAALRLVGSLFTAGKLAEAIAWLEQRANDPDATNEDRSRIAEELFGIEQPDRAAPFYRAILGREPDHVLALLRLGQIRSWGSDPRGAIPYLERRLKVTDEDAGMVRYLLGEAYWSIQDREQALRIHEAALPDLLLATRTPDTETMIAKILVRLGRVEEAEPIYDEVIANEPRNVHLILDYADAMVAAGRLEKARAILERARAIEPKHARLLRLDAEILVKEKRYGESAEVYREALRLYGSDAGLEAGLGYALELGGSWGDAVGAYGRSLVLQPGNLDVERSLADLFEHVGNRVSVGARWSFIGEDYAIEIPAEISFAFRDSRDRLTLGAGAGFFSGRAAVVANGTVPVEDRIVSLRASFASRFNLRNEWAVGLEGYPGAAGDFPLGGWGSLLLQGLEPSRTLGVRVGVHELLRAPTASVGLGGRRTGISVEGSRDLGRRWFAGAGATLESLSLDPTGRDSVTDGRFLANLSAGYRLSTAEPRVDLYFNYNPVRLLGNQELAALIPIGERFDYLTAGVRLSSGRPRLRWLVSVYAGVDAHSDDNIWGVVGDLVYRPGARFELRFGGEAGSAFGRSSTEIGATLRFAAVWRW